MKFIRFTGIGEASAAITLAALAANPTTLPFTTGLLGKATFFFLKIFFMFLASLGLIVMNVGAAKLETVIDQHDFDGSFESAEKLIKKIRDSGKEITETDAAYIDAPVIIAFRKFANFGKKKKGTK